MNIWENKKNMFKLNDALTVNKQLLTYSDKSQCTTQYVYTDNIII